MSKTYTQQATREINPEKSGRYNTDKGELYWFKSEGEWSCRDDRVSEEYPRYWYQPIADKAPIDQIREAFEPIQMGADMVREPQKQEEVSEEMRIELDKAYLKGFETGRFNQQPATPEVSAEEILHKIVGQVKFYHNNSQYVSFSEAIKAIHAFANQFRPISVPTDEEIEKASYLFVGTQPTGVQNTHGIGEYTGFIEGAKWFASQVKPMTPGKENNQLK